MAEAPPVPAPPEPAPTPPAPPEPTPEPTPTANGEGDLPDAVKEILAKERKAAKEADKRARAAEARAKEFEDKDKSEAQKLAEKAQQAERDAAEARQELLRLKVANQKGLTGDRAELASFLTGSTEEELSAAADRLLAHVKPPTAGAGALDGGARGTAAGGDMNSLLRQAAGRG